MDKTEEMIVALLQAYHGTAVAMVTVQQRIEGPQGYFGALLRYYAVAYALHGRAVQLAIVTKEASLSERCTLDWLNQRSLPTPFSYIADLRTETPALVCMEYIGDPPPTAGRPGEIAQSLAAIHHAALGRSEDLPWLPHADYAFLAERVIDICWRRPWRHLLTGEGYTDWFDRAVRDGEPDANFGAAFANVTPAIEAIATRFLRELTAIEADAMAQTLIHTDLHGEHIRWQRDHARLIDWDQARYGPLYLDLPNLYSREEALLYRNALADLGHTIPRDKFLAGYDAVRPYPGFKYFGIGLWNWRHGDPARRHANVQYWIDMVLGAQE